MHFKNAFCRTVRVHFVGAWWVIRFCYEQISVRSNVTFRDTVSAVGLIAGKTFPFTTTGMDTVCLFRHALALDERRVKFIPEFAYGTRSVPGPDAKAEKPSTAQRTTAEGQAEVDEPVATRPPPAAGIEAVPSIPSPTETSPPFGTEHPRATTLNATTDKTIPSTPSHTKEVWFTGSHSDMYAITNLNPVSY